MTHANLGVGWERTLEGWHDTYRRESAAVVFRTPPPVKVLGKVSKAGRFAGCFGSDGPPDYAGVVAPRPGRAAFPVCFDAKSSSTDRWPFASLARHQARDLEAWSHNGGYAFIALELGGANADWVLPWSELGPRWWSWWEVPERARRGTASIGVEDLERWARRMPEHGDWLGAIR